MENRQNLTDILKDKNKKTQTENKKTKKNNTSKEEDNTEDLSYPNCKGCGNSFPASKLIDGLCYQCHPKNVHVQKIDMNIINDFINWIKTIDVDKYPIQKQVINQIKKWNRSTRILSVLTLYQLYLDRNINK